MLCLQVIRLLLKTGRIPRSETSCCDAPVRLTGSEWKKSEIERLTKEIEDNLRYEAEDRARVDGRNRWIDELFASIGE